MSYAQTVMYKSGNVSFSLDEDTYLVCFSKYVYVCSHMH